MHSFVHSLKCWKWYYEAKSALSINNLVLAIFWSQKIWKKSQKYLFWHKMTFRWPNSRFCILSECYFKRVLPCNFSKNLQKNRDRHVIWLILHWKQRIRWVQFSILNLIATNLELWPTLALLVEERPILTRNAESNLFTVEISNLSQRIRHLVSKISHIACLTRFFGKILRKLHTEYPLENTPTQKHKIESWAT